MPHSNSSLRALAVGARALAAVACTTNLVARVTLESVAGANDPATAASTAPRRQP